MDPHAAGPGSHAPMYGYAGIPIPDPGQPATATYAPVAPPPVPGDGEAAAELRRFIGAFRATVRSFIGSAAWFLGNASYHRVMSEPEATVPIVGALRPLLLLDEQHVQSEAARLIWAVYGLRQARGTSSSEDPAGPPRAPTIQALLEGQYPVLSLLRTYHAWRLKFVLELESCAAAAREVLRAHPDIRADVTTLLGVLGQDTDEAVRDGSLRAMVAVGLVGSLDTAGHGAPPQGAAVPASALIFDQLTANQLAGLPPSMLPSPSAAGFQFNSTYLDPGVADPAVAWPSPPYAAGPALPPHLQAIPPPAPQPHASAAPARGRAPQRRATVSRTSSGEVLGCSECGATESPGWRRGERGERLCNSCGLRYTRLKARERRRKPTGGSETGEGEWEGAGAPGVGQGSGELPRRTPGGAAPRTGQDEPDPGAGYPGFAARKGEGA